ncbi:glycosyltransferase [Thalassoglobus sp. JC818]|uniref:glycosyltransferase n=1 Tax=Thalassoglobus sp. JC818 TaxID=3232136 RepID=UPI003459E013
MIFVTVGSLQSFDRLVQAVDEWVQTSNSSEEVIAQIGKSTYEPKSFQPVETLTPDEYRSTFDRARLVVAHAGMGTIITALETGKLTVVMPRRGHLNETRNDHQMATVSRFKRSERIRVAEDEAALPGVLDELADADESTIAKEVWNPDPNLIIKLKEFIG